MNNFLIAAGTAVLGVATTALTSRIGSTAEVRESLLQHCFKSWRRQTAAQLEPDPTARVDSQMIDEESGEPATHQSTLYDLAASSPYVIAASPFLRKHHY